MKYIKKHISDINHKPCKERAVSDYIFYENLPRRLVLAPRLSGQVRFEIDKRKIYPNRRKILKNIHLTGLLAV